MLSPQLACKGSKNLNARIMNAGMQNAKSEERRAKSEKRKAKMRNYL